MVSVRVKPTFSARIVLDYQKLISEIFVYYYHKVGTLKQLFLCSTNYTSHKSLGS